MLVSLASAHLDRIKTAAPAGLVVRHSGPGDTPRAVGLSHLLRAYRLSWIRKSTVCSIDLAGAESLSLIRQGSPPRQGAEVCSAQGLRWPPQPKDQRRRKWNSRGGLAFIAATIYVIRFVYVAGRLSIRRRKLGRSSWDVTTSRVVWLLNCVVGRVRTLVYTS